MVVTHWNEKWDRGQKPRRKSTGVSSRKETTLVAWPNVNWQFRIALFIKVAMFRCQGKIPGNSRSKEISRQNSACTHNLFDFLSLSLSLFLSLLVSTFVATRRKKKICYIFLYKCSFFCNEVGCSVQPGRKNSSCSIQHMLYVDVSILYAYVIC